MSRGAYPIIAVTLAAAAFGFVAPAAGQAQTAEDVTSEVTFYGHVFAHDRTNPMPMNTQFPKGEADYSIGSSAHHCGTPDVSCEDDISNELWFYSTAGFVQVKNREEFGGDYGLFHNERGLTKDTTLDTAQDITAEFYMSADYHGWLIALSEPGTPSDFPWPVPAWNWDPGVLMQWQVEATIYHGILGEYGGAANEAPDIATAFAEGKLQVLAQGVSAPQDVQSLEPAGQPTVWKFDINLGRAQQAVIPKEESYVVRFQWWGVKPDGSRMVLPEVDVWNVNSGEQFPPLIRLPVKGAFNVELVIPQFVYDKLVILGIMNTPWGSYDVDHDSITLEVRDSAGQLVEPGHLVQLADFSVAHGGHYKPVNVTYVWDYKADGLEPGEYTVTISANNFQGSAAASCTGRFFITPGGQGGDIQVGECGVRTATEEQVNNLRSGSANDAAGSPRAPLAIPQVGVLAAGVQPVSALPIVPLALLALAGVLVTRRWFS